MPITKLGRLLDFKDLDPGPFRQMNNASELFTLYGVSAKQGEFFSQYKLLMIRYLYDSPEPWHGHCYYFACVEECTKGYSKYEIN